MERLTATAAYRSTMAIVLFIGAISGAGSLQAATAATQLPPLNPYTLPDKTASIRLPADWHVVQTGVAFIRAQGPNGELAIFGIVVPAHDAPSTAVTPAGVNQPYAAELKDKFTQSLDWVLERLGKGSVPVNIVSDTPFKAPAQFGTCANFTMLLGQGGAVAAEADFCSLPPGQAGAYMNFFKIVGLGSANAKAERPMLEAILSSYELNPSAIKQQRANAGPQQAAASQGMASANSPQSQAAALVSLQQTQIAAQLMMAQVNAINSSTNYAMQSANASFNTFDHNLRGDTPVYGTNSSQPLFWVGD